MCIRDRLKTLGMSFGDTTIKGFKIDPGWNASSKEEIKKYQRKKNLVLFQLQKEKTRYGDTAFFIQAPGDECYNKLKIAHDQMVKNKKE